MHGYMYNIMMSVFFSFMHDTFSSSQCGIFSVQSSYIAGSDRKKSKIEKIPMSHSLE